MKTGNFRTIKAASQFQRELKEARQNRAASSAAHKAAEELRLEGKGSEDPMYASSKKNK